MPGANHLSPAAPAGKDRTGLVIALLLLTLGVPEEVVVLDYAKSEVELKVCLHLWPHLTHQVAALLACQRLIQDAGRVPMLGIRSQLHNTSNSIIDNM